MGAEFPERCRVSRAGFEPGSCEGREGNEAVVGGTVGSLRGCAHNEERNPYSTGSQTCSGELHYRWQAPPFYICDKHSDERTPVDVVSEAMREVGGMKVTSLTVALLTDALLERCCTIAGVRR